MLRLDSLVMNLDPVWTCSTTISRPGAQNNKTVGIYGHEAGGQQASNNHDW